MMGKLWNRAHAPYQGQRGTARARATHVERCLVGLHEPVQSNPWNTPCLKSNSCVGERGWGLQGWCEVPGTGWRSSLANRASSELFGEWDPAPLCHWEQPAMQRSDYCFPTGQTARCLCKRLYSFRAVRKAGHRARSRVSFNFFFSEHHI